MVEVNTNKQFLYIYLKYSQMYSRSVQEVWEIWHKVVCKYRESPRDDIGLNILKQQTSKLSQTSPNCKLRNNNIFHNIVLWMIHSQKQRDKMHTLKIVWGRLKQILSWVWEICVLKNLKHMRKNRWRQENLQYSTWRYSAAVLYFAIIVRVWHSLETYSHKSISIFLRTVVALINIWLLCSNLLI